MKRRQAKLTGLMILLMLTVMSLSGAKAQCGLKEIKLEERVNSSDLIIEGTVTSSYSLWDNSKQNIYTINTIEVTKVFKGTLSGTSVQVLTEGGIVGDQLELRTNTLELGVGNTGVFTLTGSKKPLAISNLYEAYASKQGFIAYEKNTKQARGTFDKYQKLDGDLYESIEKLTGQQRKELKALNWNKVNEHAKPLNSNVLEQTHEDHLTADTLSATNVSQAVSSGGSISSFSPTTGQAGRKTLLTINGSGFGASQSTSYVQFYNADDGGSSYITPLASEYVSWSDTKIEVYIPTAAGTGKIRVSDGTNTLTSSGNITIEYALLNVTYNSEKIRPNHASDDGNGGYSFQMYTGFESNTSAATDFQNVIYQWRCETGINWVFGTSTSTNTTASDGINIVRFDSGTELSSGVLGQCTSRYSGCVSGSTTAWYISELDVTIDDGTNYFYGNSGSPTASQYDFYTVMLHELGHGHQLGHVIDASKVMHYSLTNGSQKRTISSSESTGAAYQLAQSTAAGTCSASAHIDYDCTPDVTLSVSSSSISETSGTSTITATLSKRNFSAVTVNLSLSGTATTTSDYTLSTSITIPAGSLSASISLASVSDNKDENDETVIIDISSVTNGTESGTQQQTLTITDDDAAPSVTLSASSSNIAEAAGTSTITATLSAASSFAVTVNLSFSGTATTTSDYTLSTSITIAAGSTSGTATLTGVNDAVYEGSETAIIDISSVSNGSESGTQQQTVTLNDDESVPTVSLSIGSSSISETSGTSTVTATLSGTCASSVVVSLGTSGTATSTTDYTLGSSITISAGSTSAAITLSSVSDALDENNETVIIDITGVTVATENGTQQQTVTINDDDATPTVTIAWSNTSIGEGPAGTSNAVVTLSAASGLDVDVTLSFSGTATLNTDYTVTGSSFTIPAGSTSGFVTMNNITDNIYEGNENITVDIASVTNATEVGTQNASMTQNDDDSAPSVTLSAASSSVYETSGSTTLTATLSNESAFTTTINLSASGTATDVTDYNLSATSISIAAGSLTGSVTLTTVSDSDYEGDETVIVDISSVTNGTENGTQQQTVSLSDDDTKLNSSSCGITLSAMSDALYIENVTNATNYRYLIEHSATGFSAVSTKGSSSNLFRMSWITTGVKYGSTYTVKVAAYVNGAWQSYGTACNITTPATQLQSTYCGKSVTTTADALYCYEVAEATNYRYLIENTATGFSKVSTRGSSSNLFRLSWVSGIETARTYTISVAAYVNGSWTSYGPTCTVTVPVTSTKLASSSCDVSIPALSTALYSDAVANATNYRYLVVNSAAGFSKVSTRGSNDNLFRLSWVSGTQLNTTYSISVAAYVNGVWGDYSTVCTVTTPSALISETSSTQALSEENELFQLEDVSLEAYPNPSKGQFTLSSSHATDLSIVNELGAVVQRVSLYEENRFQHTLTDLPAGMYFITGTINNTVLTKKVSVVE